jgi:hypothetical protein
LLLLAPLWLLPAAAGILDALAAAARSLSSVATSSASCRCHVLDLTECWEWPVNMARRWRAVAWREDYFWRATARLCGVAHLALIQLFSY